MKHPLALVILDGWGHSTTVFGNAIVQAQPPFFNHLIKNYPHTFLKHQELPLAYLENMPGNSAVGHLTLGSGKIIKQPVAWLSHTLEDGSLAYKSDFIEKLTSLARSKKISISSGFYQMAVCMDLLSTSMDYVYCTKSWA